jgi:hypothetical protein
MQRVLPVELRRVGMTIDADCVHLPTSPRAISFNLRQKNIF